MSTATVSSKGQVVIPSDVRTRLGIATGDRVEFIELEPGRYEIVPATHSVKALKGLIPKPKKPVSIEAMNEAIAEEGKRAR